jgi:DnaJ-class molecular chaperone
MILDVAYYPPWKDKIVRGMARVLFRGKVHVIVIHGFSKTEKATCSPCNGTGRVMQVDTYYVVDCPRCYGRGRSTCPV